MEAQFRKGPPSFLRPGWTSPLLGKKVDLKWIDIGPFERIKGSLDGWKEAKLLVIELWASYVPSFPQVLAGARRRHTRAAGLEILSPCRLFSFSA